MSVALAYQSVSYAYNSIPSAPISQRFYGVPPHPMLSQRRDKTLDFMLFLIPWRLSALIDSPA
jgi:hypothetical protein